MFLSWDEYSALIKILGRAITYYQHTSAYLLVEILDLDRT